MRDRLIYILKHNKLIQKLYVVIMSFIFKVWGVFLKTDDKLMLFVSFMGKNFNDSPKVLYDYIQSHPEYKGYRCVWAFEHPENFPELKTVQIDTITYFKMALKAKYWISNTNIERGLKFKKKGQVYLNTWHGIALKYIGNDCPGRNDYNFDTLDYLTVSGDYDEHIFKSAFNARESCYLRCGMPRNDKLWLADENTKEQICKKLGIPKGKKVILYAPTWRESRDSGKSYAIKPPIHFDEWQKELGNAYVVLFRAHHQTTKVLGVEYNDFVRNVSEYPDVNDLMIASDILITDYSSIAFDYSILCRPIFCYAYDYDSYLAERGTYFAVDEKYPNKSCRTETELLQQIKGIDYVVECANTKRFRDEFVQYGVGATEICIENLFKMESKVKDVSIFKRIRIALMRSAVTRTKYIVEHKIFESVGNNFFFQPRIIPINAKYIKFHNNVAVASNVTFCNHDVIQRVFNNIDSTKQYRKKYGCIEVMDNVFIGANSTILYDVRIGPNAIVAAGSVVTKDVPEGTIVGGVPAQIIGSFDVLYQKRMEEFSCGNRDVYDVDTCWKEFNRKHSDGNEKNRENAK